MSPDFVISRYIDRAMRQAVYEKLDDGSYAGEIEICPGVYSFGSTLWECQEQLRSVLEGWILLGLQMGHPLPIVDGVDLNPKPKLEPMESM